MLREKYLAAFARQGDKLKKNLKKTGYRKINVTIRANIPVLSVFSVKSVIGKMEQRTLCTLTKSQR